MTIESHSESHLNPQAKHVWIVNHHAVLPSKDGGSARHLNLAKLLPDHGWTATLIVASTRHADGSQALKGFRLRKLSRESGVDALWIRANSYGRRISLRFLGMISFALNLLRPLATRGLHRPDVVIGSTVHPIAAWAGYRLARRFRVPFVYEIRDVWPESLSAVAGISMHSPLAKVLSYIDGLLISRAALVISPLPNLDLHLSDMGYPDKPFLWVANGSELSDTQDELVDRDGEPFTFMYLGAHGLANGLGDLIEAFDKAASLSPEGSMRLRLVGDGPLKNSLISHASFLRSSEWIIFEDYIPKSQVLKRAREADCLVVNVLDKPVYRFGVSLNKYFMYMAAGRPIIVAASAPNNPILDSGSGIGVEGGDISGMADAMTEMSRLPLTARREFARGGRSELERNYTFDVLAHRLVSGLQEVTKA